MHFILGYLESPKLWRQESKNPPTDGSYNRRFQCDDTGPLEETQNYRDNRRI
jgi:hypothetical protein